jgi:hypothetical protein
LFSRASCALRLKSYFNSSIAGGPVRKRADERRGIQTETPRSIAGVQENIMSITAFRAVSIGLLAGLATFLALGPGAGHGPQLWAAFIAWASFIHLGGGLEGLKKTIIHNVFGALSGAVALGFATQFPSGSSIDYPAWAAIGVASTICAVVLASRLPAFSDVASSLLGYVAIFIAAAPDIRMQKIVAPNLENPIVGVFASLIIGALLAFIAEAIADFLRKRLLRGGAGSTAGA